MQNKVIKIPAIVLFLIMALLRLNAQDDFKPGFIVTHNNDTLYGFIDLQPDARNAVQCNYKTDEQEAIQSYTPYEIKAYRFIDGKFYVSREVNLNRISRKVFLEYLVDGVADLFYIRNNDADHYFLEKDTTGLVELTNKTMEVTRPDEMDLTKRDSVTYEIRDEKFKGVLRYFYQHDPALYKKIDYAKFGSKSLIDITQEYHNHTCSDQKCIVYKKTMKGIFHAGPKLGVRQSYLNFIFSDDYTSNTSFGSGVQLRFSPKFLHYRWNLLVDLMFNRIEYNGIYTRVSEGGLRTDYDVHLKSDMVRVPLLVEYTIPFKVIKPTFSLGYDNVFLVNSDYSIYSNYYMDNSLYPYCWGLLMGMGLKSDLGKEAQFFLQAEYEFQSTFYQLKSSVDINCWDMHSLYFSIGLDYCLY